MSEDGIHGTQASREQFARDHPNYDNPHPKTAHGGGRPPLPYKPPTGKHVAVATTHEHHFVKKTCHLVAVKVLCEHSSPKPRYAAKEEEEGKQEKDAEESLTLSVVPHGSASVVQTTSKSGVNDTRQALSDHSLEKFSEPAKSKLEDHRRQSMQNYEKIRELRASKNKNLYHNVQYRVAANAHRNDQKAYSREEHRFMKTYGDHVHVGAELYFDQGDPTLPDVLTLEAQMTRHCSKHPQWGVWDCSTNEWVDVHEGLQYKTHALLPPLIGASYLESHSVLPTWVPGEKAYWLKGIEPRRYKIHLFTCEGDRVTHVNVYPLAQSGINFKASLESGSVKPKPGTWSARMHEIQEKWENGLAVVNKIAPGGKVHVGILPEGSLELTNGWKEEEGSHEAVWFGKIKADATLFKLGAAKSLLDSLPGYISSIVKQCTDVGIDLGVELTVKVKVEAEWTHAPEQKSQKSPTVKGGLEGELVGKVDFYAEARFFGMDLCGVHVTGSTTFLAVSEFEFASEEGKEKIKVDLFLEWQKPFDLMLYAHYTNRHKSYEFTFFAEKPPQIHCCTFDLLEG